MALPPSKRRLTRLLRRTAKAPPTSAASRLASEEHAFWTAHERAVARAREAGAAAQAIASTVAKQRASVDALADRARIVASRTQELAAIFGRISAVFDRLGLVALNAGLEGARLGEAAGRAVLLVSDEVRSHTQRGGESVRELSTALGELSQELGAMGGGFEPARTAASEIAQYAASAAGAASEAERALAEIEAKIRSATGSDPETARAIAQTSARAQELVRSLGELGDRLPQEVLLEALRPTLEPLLRLFLEEGAGDEQGSEPPPPPEAE